ncbi:hypothetical protein [Amycolatopsis japonica]|uniref:hypothetical protein n=1 Tax=Amycolatopsis japonica TaxID=208439 RepID=UPI0033C002F1
MADDQSTRLSLDLFFAGGTTFANVLTILKDVEGLYNTCFALAAPDADPASEDNQPQIEIHTGSLLVELSAALAPGAWGGMALLTMKFMLNNGPELAKLPHNMRDSYWESKRIADEHRDKANLVRRHSPSVGKEAKRMTREVKSLRKLLEGSIAEPNIALTEGEAVSSTTNASEAFIAQLKRAVKSISHSAKTSADQLANLSSQTEQLHSSLAFWTAGSAAPDVKDAVQALSSTKQPLDNAVGLLRVVQRSLNDYAERIDRS